MIIRVKDDKNTAKVDLLKAAIQERGMEFVENHLGQFLYIYVSDYRVDGAPDADFYRRFECVANVLPLKWGPCPDSLQPSCGPQAVSS